MIASAPLAQVDAVHNLSILYIISVVQTKREFRERRGCVITLRRTVDGKEGEWINTHYGFLFEERE
jgi:hypothetical protein